MTTAATYAQYLTHALESPVHSPLSLLATAVIGTAVIDQRADRRYVIRIGAYWLHIADVDPQLLESEGVEVDNSLPLVWEFGR
jgi:hypothetical protein